MRIRLDISYDGHRYFGFQKQPDFISIQGELERVLSKIFNSDILVVPAGRTDAGVHALQQVVAFTVDKEEVDLNRLMYAINRMIESDIHVNRISKVDDDFHPRINVDYKVYHYLINTGDANPFYRMYRYEFMRPLDVKKMKKASKLFLGTHNFQNFTTKKEDNRAFIRTIFEINFQEKNDVITIEVIGSGFMRYMVRMIVGTLIMIGLNKENIEFIQRKLDTKDKQRETVIYKAPACGLYLNKVVYIGEK